MMKYAKRLAKVVFESWNDGIYFPSFFISGEGTFSGQKNILKKERSKCLCHPVEPWAVTPVR
jgi:hypothetical protein